MSIRVWFWMVVVLGGVVAVPAAAQVAEATAALRRAKIVAEGEFGEQASSLLRTAWQAMQQYPHGHVTLITALEEYLTPPEIVVIRGGADEVNRWRDSAHKLYAPGRLVLAIPETEDALPGLLAERKPVAGETVAYRCVGTHCELPVKTWEALAPFL